MACEDVTDHRRQLLKMREVGQTIKSPWSASMGNDSIALNLIRCMPSLADRQLSRQMRWIVYHPFLYLGCWKVLFGDNVVARVYRAMTNENGRPQLARSSTGLGVRVPDPGKPLTRNHDIPVGEDNSVLPGTGGMSVAPDWRSLPSHRIPRRLRNLIPSRDARGKDSDACWRFGSGEFRSGSFAEGLQLDVDGATHATVQPDRQMTLDDYEAFLSKTRDAWEIDET